MTRSKPVIIGLTGPTGSGKGIIADVLRGRGAYVIDADRIAHAVLFPGGAAYSEVVANLGAGILNDDKTINRKTVAAVVFNDKTKLQQHTETTHKHILKQIRNEIDAATQAGYKIICIDAPLLTESGLHERCDVTIAVRADDRLRMERIMERDGLTQTDAERRMASQTPFEEIARRADVIFDNNAGPEDLARKAASHIDQWLNG